MAELIKVSKNGKFLGFADEGQIRRSKGKLVPMDGTPAPATSEPAPTPEPEELAEEGAKPSEVKREPETEQSTAQVATSEPSVKPGDEEKQDQGAKPSEVKRSA